MNYEGDDVYNEERTITEADVYEFSFPQYEGATARVEEAK